MLVRLFWTDRWNNGCLYPEGQILKKISDIKGLIFEFLSDDEGLGLEHLKNWIDEGLIQIKKVRLGELGSYDMWGQAWGADISLDNVLIYWGYDDNIYEESMSFQNFYTIIKNWKVFLNSEPSLDNVIEFELS